MTSPFATYMPEAYYLNIDGVASLRGVAIPTVFRWVKHPTNSLIAYKPGKEYLINIEDARNYQPAAKGWPRKEKSE